MENKKNLFIIFLILIINPRMLFFNEKEMKANLIKLLAELKQYNYPNMEKWNENHNEKLLMKNRIVYNINKELGEIDFQNKEIYHSFDLKKKTETYYLYGAKLLSKNYTDNSLVDTGSTTKIMNIKNKIQVLKFKKYLYYKSGKNRGFLYSNKEYCLEIDYTNNSLELYKKNFYISYVFNDGYAITCIKNPKKYEFKSFLEKKIYKTNDDTKKFCEDMFKSKDEWLKINLNHN